MYPGSQPWEPPHPAALCTPLSPVSAHVAPVGPAELCAHAQPAPGQELPRHLQLCPQLSRLRSHPGQDPTSLLTLKFPQQDPAWGLAGLCSHPGPTGPTGDTLGSAAPHSRLSQGWGIVTCPPQPLTSRDTAQTSVCVCVCGDAHPAPTATPPHHRHTQLTDTCAQPWQGTHTHSHHHTHRDPTLPPQPPAGGNTTQAHVPGPASSARRAGPGRRVPFKAPGRVFAWSAACWGREAQGCAGRPAPPALLGRASWGPRQLPQCPTLAHSPGTLPLRLGTLPP